MSCLLMKYTCKLTLDQSDLASWSFKTARKTMQDSDRIHDILSSESSRDTLSEPIFPTFTALKKKKKLGEPFTSETKNWLG